MLFRFITPTVEPAGIRYAADGKTATAHLNYTFPVGQEGWKYATTVPLENADGSWQVTWSPTVVHEKLSATTRLRHQRSWPKRAAINDRDGVALVEERTVYQVGIDKSKSEESTWQAAATQLAQLLKVDAAEYTQKVLAGGPKQFVVAKTVTPMSPAMTLMMAQEIPMLDSKDRVRVYEILDNYDGPEITSQEELPQEIRDLMDL